jgi:hypothetical protein
MLRGLRIQYRRAMYHVMSRGDRREKAEAKAERIIAEELRRLRWGGG